MGLKALPLPSSSATSFTRPEGRRLSNGRLNKVASTRLRVSAKTEKGEEEVEEPKKIRKQSLFGSVTEALDFSQVRSAEDAQLIEDAREATQSGRKMSKEQVIINYNYEINPLHCFIGK